VAALLFSVCKETAGEPMAMESSQAIIVHGGAWAIPDDQVTDHIAGCTAARTAGWQILQQGGSALDAVEAAVRVMEDDPIFDAGTGSVLTSAGTVELDAALMDGRTLRYGAVAGLRRIRNPITLARYVLQGPATMLVGTGAEEFAATVGIPFCDNADLIVERERRLWLEWKAQGALCHPLLPVVTILSARLPLTAKEIWWRLIQPVARRLSCRVGSVILRWLGVDCTQPLLVRQCVLVGASRSHEWPWREEWLSYSKMVCLHRWLPSVGFIC
jgi:hypothetical protein